MSRFHGALYTVAVDKPRSGFRLTHPLGYSSDLIGYVEAPVTFFSDFASIPWFGRWIIPVNAKHRSPAVIHDWLCENSEALDIPQKLIDQVFLEAMASVGVRFTRRQTMYGLVRAYQETKSLWESLRVWWRK